MDIETKIKISTSLESVYSSNMRNAFVIFTLGLTIINLSKAKYKYLFALLLIMISLVLGINSTVQYYKKIKLIDNNNLNDFNTLTNNIFIIIIALVLLTVIFSYRFILMNKKYGFFKN
jgi:hypothetical protein